MTKKRVMLFSIFNKNLLRVKITLVILFSIECQSFANNLKQGANYHFEKILSQNDLSNQPIRCFFMDHLGYMWIGTDYGLCKYDGSNITVYRKQPNDSLSLLFNKISSVYEDTNGNLCVIGANVYDDCSYNRDFDNFSRHTADTNSLVYPFPIPANKTGAKYLCTKGDVYQKNSNSNLFEKVIFRCNSDTLAIESYVEDNEGKLWIGSFTRGLLKFDALHKTLVPFLPFPNNKSVSVNCHILSLHYDSEGMIWVGRISDELDVFDPKKEIYIKKWNNENNEQKIDFVTGSFCEDENGQIWIASANGINIYNKKDGRFIILKNNVLYNKTLNTNIITTLYKTNQGTIWLGALDGSVHIYDPYRIKFNNVLSVINNSDNIKNKSVKSAYKDTKGILWIGTDFGLNKMDANGKIIKTYSSNKSNINSISPGGVCAIHEDKTGLFWIGTWGGGLCRFNPNSEIFTRFNYKENSRNNAKSIGDANILCINEDADGLLWLGTLIGIVDVFDPKSETFEHIDLKAEFIRSMLIDQKNNSVWCCTANGLIRIDKKSKKITQYLNNEKDVNSISDNYTTNIVKDKDNFLWITTLNGLNRFDYTKGTFTQYNNINNIELKNLYGLQIDKQNCLWFSNSSYLLKFNPENETLWHYNENEGAILNIRYSNILSTGEMAFGGFDGVNVFYPESIKNNEQAPQIEITDFKVFGKSVKCQDSTFLSKAINRTKSINLTYKTNVFGFDFTTLSYSAGDKCQFACKLDGIDKDWNFIGNKKSITYSHIPAGHYIFKVKASNNEGFWGNNEVAINVNISPPFWETIWFRIISVLTLIASIILWLRYKTFALNKRNAYLERLVKIRTNHLDEVNAELEMQKEEVESQKDEVERMATIVHDSDQKRIRFLINISHEFRTPLTLIINPVGELLTKLATNRELHATLNTIAKNAHSLLNLINQVLDLRKLETNNMQLEVAEHDIQMFLSNLFGSFSHLAHSQTIKYTLETNIEDVKVWFDAPKMERVLINLLSNAFKFTSPKGAIELKAVIVHEDKIRISVTDTGIGIAEDQLQLIFDSYYQAKNDKYGMVYGTGIGLNLAKELVELHHGSIHVNSVVGKGSCFWVEFPFQKSSYADNELSFKNDAQTTQLDNILNENFETHNLHIEDLPHDLPKEAPTILIAEDNNDLRLFVKQNLAPHYHVIEAENGAIGYELVCKFMPDLVISDIMMPEMNGFELCEKIKTDINVSHIPIILLTAVTDEDSQVKGLSIGADEYLAKPFNVKVLLARIANMLETRKKMRERFSRELVVQPSEISISSIDEQFLTKCIRIIEKNISDEKFGVPELSQEISISKSALGYKLKNLTNLSPGSFINTIRLKRAAELLKYNHATVAEISYMVGFNSSSVFIQAFKKQFGTTPAQYIHE